VTSDAFWRRLSLPNKAALSRSDSRFQHSSFRLEPGRLEHLSAWVGQSGALNIREQVEAQRPKFVESALGELVSGDLCRQPPALRLAHGSLQLSTSTFATVLRQNIVMRMWWVYALRRATSRASSPSSPTDGVGITLYHLFT
jgi:hypothetical protein